MNVKPITVGLDVSCLVDQPLTGVGHYTAQLLRAMVSAGEGPEFRLFASSASPIPDIVRALGRVCSKTKTLYWPTRLKTWMWRRLEWPPIEWFTGRVDVAHGAFHLLPAARSAKRIVTIYDLTEIRRAETRIARRIVVNRRVLEHAAQRSDAIVAISDHTKRDVAEVFGVPLERIYVVYGGVRLEEFQGGFSEARTAEVRQRYGIRGPYFIHLGTLEPRKNLPRLIEAYARVRQGRADCPVLVLAGKKGWMWEPIFEAIAAHRLEEAVVYTGYMDRGDAATLLRGAWACLYPSLYEGFGLPVLEAMAAHTPVLTSNVSSLPEVVGDTGLLVNPEDTDAIAAGILALIDERTAALQRADAALERAAQFTWEKSAAAMIEVYRKVVAE